MHVGRANSGCPCLRAGAQRAEGDRRTAIDAPTPQSPAMVSQSKNDDKQVLNRQDAPKVRPKAAQGAAPVSTVVGPNILPPPSKAAKQVRYHVKLVVSLRIPPFAPAPPRGSAVSFPHERGLWHAVRYSWVTVVECLRRFGLGDCRGAFYLWKISARGIARHYSIFDIKNVPLGKSFFSFPSLYSIQV